MQMHKRQYIKKVNIYKGRTAGLCCSPFPFEGILMMHSGFLYFCFIYSVGVMPNALLKHFEK